MNHLISIRSNTLYAKEKEGYKRFTELVFLVDKPIYKTTNEGEIIRERGVEEQRFIVSDASLKLLIQTLNSINTEEETK